MSGQRLPRAERIQSRGDFLRIQRLGRQVRTPSFVVIVLPAEHTRIGITVTRKTAGAVGRNRIKRLAREVYRRNRGLFPTGCELVLVARARATRLDYEALRAELAAVRTELARAATGSRGPAPRVGSGADRGGRA